MKKTRRRPLMHVGISFGSILMIAVTVVVTGLSATILPRLLGKADFDVNVGSALSALELDDSLTALSLSDIPIIDVTPTPAPSTEPALTAPAVTDVPAKGENQ